MKDDELIARLRAWEPLVSSGYGVPAAGQPMHEAAARIEALTAEVERVKEELLAEKQLRAALQPQEKMG